MSLRMLGMMVVRGTEARLSVPVKKFPKDTIAKPCQIIAVQQMQRGVSGFSYEGLKKNWSAIPMVAICVVVIIGVPITAFIIAKTRPDVQFTIKGGPLSDRIDLDNAPYLKGMKLDDSSSNLPEVAELYREMGVSVKK